MVDTPDNEATMGNGETDVRAQRLKTAYSPKMILVAAGSFSLAIAALHVAIVFVGSRAYLYFGAGEWMADQAASGSLVPALLTVFIALVFGVCGAYAFAGAGLLKRLPLLKPGLLLIAAVYLLRGAMVFTQAVRLVRVPGSVAHRELVFSGVSLLAGLLHAGGIWACWKHLGGSARGQ
jgi:hypothetical protein